MCYYLGSWGTFCWFEESIEDTLSLWLVSGIEVAVGSYWFALICTRILATPYFKLRSSRLFGYLV